MKVKKCIILAGGNAKRLWPLTEMQSKHLLPIYNKPMIFYSISTLMNAGIKDFLIITKPNDLNQYKILLGNGKKYGISIKYIIQNKPKGLPDAFILAKDFIKNEPICLNLGDHIFFGKDVKNKVSKIVNNFKISTIFTYKVNNPSFYGVVYRDRKNIIKIIEKPKKFLSDKIVCGLYFYTPDVVNFSTKLKPSKRGEIEISDLNNEYLQNNLLNIEHINKNNTWLDAGNPDDILSASILINKLENIFGQYIGSLDIIAFKKRYISIKQFKKRLILYSDNNYGQLLKKYYLKHIK